ncbi:hypothetical protein OC861_006477 [Tilletia horrida]|nr:hypothetical protein OC861_006477 [Tilletia horrida]
MPTRKIKTRKNTKPSESDLEQNGATDDSAESATSLPQRLKRGSKSPIQVTTSSTKPKKKRKQKSASSEPPVGKRSQSGKEFKYVGEEGDGDAARYVWNCNHCGAKVLTTRAVSELSIHLNGNKTSRRAPCPIYTAEKGVRDEWESGGKQEVADEQHDRQAPQTHPSEDSSIRLDPRIEKAIEAAVARALATMSAPSNSPLTSEQAVQDIRQTTSEEINTVAPNAVVEEDRNGKETAEVEMETRMVTGSVSIRDSDQEPVWEYPKVKTVVMRSDGMCGFRAAALAMHGKVDSWADIRTALTTQLISIKSSYGELWSAKEMKRLQERLVPIEEPQKMGDEFRFSSPDCFILLADLAACPIIQVKPRSSYREPGEVFPPTLQPPAADRRSAIVFVDKGMHYDLGLHYKGSLPPMHAEWQKLAEKESTGRATRNGMRRSIWLPELDELNALCLSGLDLPPPSVA